MGIAARDWAWSLDLNTPSVKLVMLCLAEHANERGNCWPSVARVIEKTGLSRRSVSGAIASLKSLGHLKVEVRNYRNRYTLALPKGGQCANSAPPMSKSCPSDEQNLPIYEPSVEPKEEPSKTLGLTPKSKPNPLQEKEGEEKEEKEMKVQEIVQKKEWQKLPKAKKESVTARVVKEWQLALLDENPDVLAVSPSMKEVGQIKHLIARVGSAQAKSLLRKTVADWEGFTYFAANGKAAPPEPHLGYLLTHVETAMLWFAKQGNEMKPKQSKGLKAYLPPGV